MLSYHFPKTHRLHKKHEFQALFSGARVTRQRTFVCFSKANSWGRARLGHAIAVKKAGGAVVRNAIKRTIRETFRLHTGCLPAMDYLITMTSRKDSGNAPPIFPTRDELMKFWMIEQKRIKGHRHHKEP